MQRILGPSIAIVAGVAGGYYVWEPMLREQKEFKEINEKNTAAAIAKPEQQITLSEPPDVNEPEKGPNDGQSKPAWGPSLWSKPPADGSGKP